MLRTRPADRQGGPQVSGKAQVLRPSLADLQGGPRDLFWHIFFLFLLIIHETNTSWGPQHGSWLLRGPRKEAKQRLSIFVGSDQGIGGWAATFAGGGW